jgi:pimeloyl-ACP methyl ester carboxylesterase
MSVLAISVGAIPSCEDLAAAMAPLPQAAPVVILIHGFRYAPGVPGHDPHELILSAAPQAPGGRIFSWPRHLRLTGESSLAIAFGWNARGGIWGAYGRAGEAGLALATLIAGLRAEAPDRPVHVVAHSLGARVALAALPHCPPGSVRRMILIAGAAFRTEARAAMASDAARGLEVLHVRGPENGLFEALLCLALPLAGPSLGAGLPGVPGWVDLALHDPATLATLERMGHRIKPARYRICHWSGYARPGVFGLYRAVLSGRVPVAALARAEARGLPIWPGVVARMPLAGVFRPR